MFFILQSHNLRVFSNTFTMRNPILALCFFVFPFFFPLCTCRIVGKEPTPPAREPLHAEDFSSETENIPMIEPVAPPDLPDPNVWDTSDVDISEIHTQKKLIAFTFDDTPSKTAENILAVFAAFNEENPDCKAFATLFVNGHFLNAESMQTLNAAHALRFELGNHTYSHYDLTAVSSEILQTEIQSTDVLLQKIDGKDKHLLRVPYGKCNDFVKERVQTPIIDWTIDTLDWAGVSAEEIVQTVLSQKFSGAIVLMHDGYPNTVTALKTLLPALKNDGYQVVSVSQLAKTHGCTLRNGKVYIRARKQ